MVRKGKGSQSIGGRVNGDEVGRIGRQRGGECEKKEMSNKKKEWENGRQRE